MAWWESLSIGVVKTLWNLWWARWRVKIRIFLTAPSAIDPELRVEVVITGEPPIYIQKVTIEGPGETPVTLFVEQREVNEHLGGPRAGSRPLANGARRIYGREVGILMRKFAGKKGVRAVVYSHRGVLARKKVPPSLLTQVSKRAADGPRPRVS